MSTLTTTEKSSETIPSTINGNETPEVSLLTQRQAIALRLRAWGPQNPPEHLVNALVHVTPAIAEELLELCFERQRPLEEGHVAKLTRAMEKDEFISGLVMLTVSNGEEQLTDAQHRLHAIIRSGKPQWMSLLWQIVADDNEVARHYVQTDADMPRKLLDRIRAIAMPGRLALSHNDCMRLLRATKQLVARFETTPSAAATAILRDEYGLLHMAEKWAEEATSYRQLTKGARVPLAGRLWTSATLSVALTTLRHQKEKAESFWRSVAHDDGLAALSHEKRLVNFLMTEELQRNQIPWDARRIAAHWNAYFWGRGTQRLSLPTPESATEPILIAGTPYDGRRLDS